MMNINGTWFGVENINIAKTQLEKSQRTQRQKKRVFFGKKYSFIEFQNKKAGTKIHVLRTI